MGFEAPSGPARALQQGESLRAITLGGFQNPDLRAEFMERLGSNYSIGGQATFWTASGTLFLYYCRSLEKWRVAGADAFEQVRQGTCFAYASDGFQRRDVWHKALIKDWIEVVDDAWVHNSDAGVWAIREVPVEEPRLKPWEEKPRRAASSSPRESKCPVTRAARFVQKKVAGLGKLAITWAQQGLDLLPAAQSQ